MAFQVLQKGKFGAHPVTKSLCSMAIYKHDKRQLLLRLSDEVADHLGTKFVTLAIGTDDDAGLLYVAPAIGGAPNAYKLTKQASYANCLALNTERLGLRSAVLKTTHCGYEIAGDGIIINYRPVIQAQANGALRSSMPAKVKHIEIRPA